MPSILVFTKKDIGQNFRLLRHIKSLASYKENKITILAPDISSLPKDIEHSTNVVHKYFYTFDIPYPVLSILLFPLEVLLYVIEMAIYISILPKYDFVLTDSSSILNSICARVFSRFLNGKLIFDIHSLKWNHKSDFMALILHYIEHRVQKMANYLIVSTKSLQIVLQLQNIKSYYLCNPPGNNFIPYDDLKTTVCDFLRIDQSQLLIGVLMSSFAINDLQMILEIARNFENAKRCMCFIIFAGSKAEKIIQDTIDKSCLSCVSIRFVHLNTDAYAQTLGCCDCGILFHGSRYGLDLTSDITDIVGCQIPILALRNGCVSEVVKEGTNGFLFKDKAELTQILNRLVSKEIDLSILKKNCTNEYPSWDEEWKKIYQEIFQVHKLHTD